MKSLTSLTPNLDLVSEFIKETGDNPVQAVLRGILKFWGPNGEMWNSGQLETEGGQRCVYGQLAHEHGERAIAPRHSICGYPEVDALRAAAKEQGFDCPIDCSNESFEHASKMVLRAISLSA